MAHIDTRGPTVNLHSRVSSPAARTHLRKLHRALIGQGLHPRHARLLVFRSLMAVGHEGDHAFNDGIRAELLARRMAVNVQRSA